MNNVVINPYEYFADPTKGRPIFNGFVYIGEPDTDPEVPANQKQVYARQEDGNDVAIPQPVLTNSGGYPTYNGSVIAIVVSGPYSLKVNNKTGEQLLYSPRVDGVATTEDYGSVLLATDQQALAGTPGVVPDAEQVRKNHVAQVATAAAAAASTNILVGTRIRTAGRLSVGDGGAGEYIVVAAATGTDDGGAFIDTAGGLQLQLIYSDSIILEQYGAVRGLSDVTAEIQSAWDFCAGNAVRCVALEGTYNASVLTTPDGLVLHGAGLKKSIIKQIAGSNADFVTSAGFGSTDIGSLEILGVDFDGTYFTSAWNAATGVLGNTSGGGLKLQGYGIRLDVQVYNTAGIGLLMEEPNASESSASKTPVYDVSVTGKDFGKEGIIIRGPNDGILRKAWIGRAGILPRPTADTTAATSTYYAADPADGIVLDNVNIEIGDVHVYACWSGTGFRTRNTCRLTKGGRVISESNRAQVVISSATYGSAFFDIRNLSLLHPNWTATIPTYTFPSEEWDGATIYADQDFTCEITCKRTITAFTRVAGSSACYVNGGAKVDFKYSNSTAPVGDSEAGSLYSGRGIALGQSMSGGKVDANLKAVNGIAVDVQSEGATVTFSAKGCTTGLYRDSVGNSKRGNNIRGTITDCDTGFESVGTPMSESINLAMELGTGATAFTGDALDVNRAQVWDISATVNNVGYGTRKFLQGSLSDAVTTEQTLTVAHNFLYTPGFQEVQYSIDDRSTVATNLEYCFLNSIDATNLTFKYKYATASNPAANQRVNIRVG